MGSFPPESILTFMYVHLAAQPWARPVRHAGPDGFLPPREHSNLYVCASSRSTLDSGLSVKVARMGSFPPESILTLCMCILPLSPGFGLSVMLARMGSFPPEGIPNLGTRYREATHPGQPRLLSHGGSPAAGSAPGEGRAHVQDW